jgi:hypothetical protein
LFTYPSQTLSHFTTFMVNFPSAKQFTYYYATCECKHGEKSFAYENVFCILMVLGTSI